MNPTKGPVTATRHWWWRDMIHEQLVGVTEMYFGMCALKESDAPPLLLVLPLAPAPAAAVAAGAAAAFPFGIPSCGWCNEFLKSATKGFVSDRFDKQQGNGARVNIYAFVFFCYAHVVFRL